MSINDRFLGLNSAKLLGFIGTIFSFNLVFRNDREALHLNVGDHVLFRVEDGELRVIPRMEAIRRAQRLVAEYIPASVSLVDELIADRRAEVAREEAQFQASERGLSEE